MCQIILLPSYKPDEKLFDCLDSLIKEGFEEFLIVDDGSGEEFSHIFDKAKSQHRGVRLIQHAVNLGKGRAMKTGFNYALNHYEGLTGVISCDSDGQHPSVSVRAVAEELEKHSDKVVLGTRRFLKGKNVPFANLFGNTFSIITFKLLTGLTFGDTQCGLRGFPTSIIRKILGVKGERFEYENMMLLDFRKDQIDYTEVPMDAIYIKNNETSHFNRYIDPFKIYFNLMSFALYSIIAGIIAYIAVIIFFATLPMCSFIKPALFYAAGLLVGWLVLMLPIPENKNKGYTILYPFLHTVICSALFYWLYNYQTFGLHGTFWLCAILAAPSAYAIYNYLKYGKKPKRIKRQ